MSAEAAVLPTLSSDLRSRRILRYAFGSSLAMAIAMAIDGQLSFLVPVLTLSFLATPDPCPTLRQGVSFVAVIVVACLVSMLLSRILLPFPLVYVPFMGLLLFRIFYAKAGGRSPLLIMWMLIAILAIPLVAMMSPDIASMVVLGIISGAASTMAVVWLVYFFFPDPPGAHSAVVQKPTAAAIESPAERFRIAAETTIVVLPVFTVFYTLQLAGSLLILIFIAILSSQPGFAKNYKAGVGLILGNVIGGAIAIVFYEVLVHAPRFPMLLLLTLGTGLFLGSRFHSDRKLAPLYGMAFSTVLLVIGSTTSGNAEAGSKVSSRILQIMAAVTYVVVAFGAMEAWRQRSEPKDA